VLSLPKGVADSNPSRSVDLKALDCEVLALHKVSFFDLLFVVLLPRI